MTGSIRKLWLGSMSRSHLCPGKRPARRSGLTLLEVIAATSLMAIALVPTLRLMRDSMKLGRRVEMLNLVTTECVNQLEEHLNLTAATWSTTTSTGALAANGYPTVRYQVTCSDQVAAGGLPDQLMAVQATVWEDQNSNGALDNNEPHSILRSKIAKLLTYENEVATP